MARGLHGMATAIVIGLYHGQRQTDLRLATLGAFQRRQVQLMGWPEPREVWVWGFTRSKRGNEGAMIIHDDATPQLEAAMAAAKARFFQGGRGAAATLADMPLLWDDIANAPFTGKGAEDRFQNRWGAIRSAAADAMDRAGKSKAAAALRELQFRDLRRSFGVLSRAGGASKDDTADVLGNSAATDQLLADIYMAPSFETASRAVLAMRRPENREVKKA